MNPWERSRLVSERVPAARALVEACCLCGHRCAVNRLEGEEGFCRAGPRATVSSRAPHHGEEPVFAGTRGSGTIFFSYCNLRCVFCQNFSISQHHSGREAGPEELGGMMRELQAAGCHNINLVSPTHFMPAVMEALAGAFEQGLDIPILYNTNGYDSLELLRLLDGIIDIYMPDFKYFDDEAAARYSGAGDYARVAQDAIREMHRQVGDLELDSDGVAVKGMLVRHLVLPNDLARSKEVLGFLASVSKDMHVGIMSQYSPQHRAGEFPELARRLTPREYDEAVDFALELGLDNALIQQMTSSFRYLPDFRKRDPFEESR